MSRELCAYFVDDYCVLLYIKQAKVVDSMLYIKIKLNTV